MQAIRVPLAQIQGGHVYAPAQMARRISNLTPQPDGTLGSARGPMPYVPDYGAGYPAQYGQMHGVYHTCLGARDVLLVRTGDALIVHQGWTGTWETLVTGLSDDPALAPDVFVEAAGVVVWSNGVDRARTYDGDTLVPLGFAQAPGAPTGHGPSPRSAGTGADPEYNPSIYRNASGYSHPGRIGTPGDLLAGQLGALRQGAWYGWVQWQNERGDLSPLSAASAPVTVRTEDATDVAVGDFLGFTTQVELGPWAVQVDDLTRQFLWRDIATGPAGTVARRFYRSADAVNADPSPRLHTVIADNITGMVPDNRSDAELGAVAPAVAPVPTFRVACAHAGRLVIGNVGGSPGVVMWSEAGFPGTFLVQSQTQPDPGGGEITALASYRGKLLAFTATSVFEVDVSGETPPQPLSTGVGCVAASTVVETGDGALTWRGYDAWYAWDGAGMRNISADIAEREPRLARGRMDQAVAVWDPETRQYLCAVPRSGSARPDLILAYDGGGWREYQYGIRWSAFTRTKDHRQLIIGVGTGAENNVFVLNREARSYTPPTKTYVFESGWLRLDPTGRGTFNVSAVYVGFVEASAGACTWRAYRNGRRDTAFVSSTSTTALTLRAPDSTVALDAAVVGTDRVRTPRLFWRRFDVAARGVDSFAFDLEIAESAGFITLAGFAFDVTPNDEAGASVPRG